jgi:hypothetical protein
MKPGAASRKSLRNSSPAKCALMSESSIPAEREEKAPSPSEEAPQHSPDPYGGVALGVECAWSVAAGFDAN